MHSWRDAVRTVRRHPVRDPDGTHFRRPAMALFVAEILVVVPVLLWLVASGDAMSWWVLAFAVAAAITEFAEIRPSVAGASVLNDLFVIVPLTFLVPAQGAAFVLLATTFELVLRPRPLEQLVARLGSTLALQGLAFAGVAIARELVPPDAAWTTAAIITGGFLGIRLNDYTLFPLSAMLGIPDEFDLREYLRASGPFEAFALVVELPLAIIAGYAWEVTPALVLLLVVPYLSIWQVSRLRPIVTELRASDELKTRFLSMASHEVRTPLTSIYGFSATLRQQWDVLDDAQRLEFVGIIEQQSARLNRLTTDLLTLSRIESGQLVAHPEPVHLRHAIEQAVRESADAEIRVDCPEELVAQIDPMHLQQVLANYLVNAHKYGEPPIEVVARRRDDWIEVRVRDHGHGVSAEFAPRLFESFSQSPDNPAVEGTGLGLAIVKRLAASYGGDAWYEAGEGGGSVFGVRIPAGDVVARPDAPTSGGVSSRSG
jgi:signal transduction histidine kinase